MLFGGQNMLLGMPPEVQSWPRHQALAGWTVLSPVQILGVVYVRGGTIELFFGEKKTKLDGVNQPEVTST